MDRKRNKEKAYIFKRLLKAKLQSALFYLFRIFPIEQNKIVFCCIEGTTGYSCNPKYIAEELLCRQKQGQEADYQLVWLVNDTTKKFPQGIRVVQNTLWNRAYQLTTAHIWIDNSRKQLEARKRKGQIYIQTWHAKLGFKPTCLDRGKSFSRIAYLVSKHDSDMVDYWLSNSDWYDRTLETGSLYTGKTLRVGSPRCDILVRAKEDRQFKNDKRQELCERFAVQEQDRGQVHFLMYAPTFRGGSQETERTVQAEKETLDYDRLIKALENQFGGTWYVMLRLHPQIVARKLDHDQTNGKLIDVSREDDLYEILAGCDAFMTDYSSAAFDAAVMEIPVFLYCEDYKEYQKERGSLLWDLEELPFPLAQNNGELSERIVEFSNGKYQLGLKRLFGETGMAEDGKATERVADFVHGVMKKNSCGKR